MTNPVTPNIGLNKIDRTSPSTTYFDLEKYIDQNADAVDRFAGESSEAIGALEKRLDTEERRGVVLQPGLQIVNAERSAPFKLSGIKGRTLVNLAGRQTNRSASNPATTTLSVGSGTTGNNTEIINVAVKNTDEGYIIYRQVGGSAFLALAGKYYVISAEVKVNSISGSGLVKVGANVGIGADTVDKTRLGIWQRIYYGFTKSADTAFDIIIGVCYAGGVYAAVNFDVKNVSLYEISQSEYNSITSYSAEQMDIKYPYVDSIQPVRNPYVIRYGENLAPTLFEGTVESSTKVLSEYSAIVKATGSTVVEYRSKLIPAIPNTNYTLRAKITLNGLEKYDGVYVDVLGYDEAGLYVLDTPGTSVNGTGTGTDIFATPANIKTMEVRIVAPQDAAVGDYVIEDIMLNLGATVKTHKPREDCILALQTDLYSDPVTGANADEVFEKNGQYFRLAKWNRKVLDGSINWVGSFPFTGFKSVRYPLTNVVVRSAIGVKYDGKILNEYGGTDAPDKVTVDNDNAYVWISNADSGWGDNYTPTSDEIKAFFMGWTMYDGTGGNQSPNTNLYNGIGAKWWARRSDGISRLWVDATAVLPTVQAPSWTPFQLVYQLANPTVDSIISEGLLTFNKGDNQIEVGTGIVLRERVKPYLDNAKWWNLGNPVANPGSTSFKYVAKQVFSVFMNNVKDFRWKVTLTEKYGALAQLSPIYHFNQLAAYSVTYLKLEKSPDVPLLGTIAVNEKSLLQELVISVQNSTTTISELMRKEEDKKVSDWITPTLLNGWVGHGSTGVSIRKNGDHLEIKGAIRAGVAISGTHIMRLPNELRPSKVSVIGTFSQNSNGDRTIIAVDIWPDGVVVINGSSTSNIGNEFLLMNASISLS
ncbi:hypothetical protein [Paenibacillus sp. ISL-20]|uniref:hypothetical protein n=1 Tax=Paenibacillus sp. ISL-20 TaxID=2819163 RepID=UPI001BE9F1EA|nr:hypothetical protein [Paenibacillus sp. ISL-20]MBT2761778.1 hypothetical protein [Paenibacillus sp. ISL-20]